MTPLPATCPVCGLPVVSPETFCPGIDRYDDTPGGHADRHTLVVEAAARALPDLPYLP